MPGWRVFGERNCDVDISGIVPIEYHDTAQRAKRRQSRYVRLRQRRYAIRRFHHGATLIFGMFGRGAIGVRDKRIFRILYNIDWDERSRRPSYEPRARRQVLRTASFR